MKIALYQVDAFTDELFHGNPAAICFLDEWLDTNLMQKIATEMNQSETAFIIPEGDRFEIRYFTPSVEVPLCGHATLASGHIIYELGLVSTDDTINFKAKGGDLAISRESDWIVMNFPAYPLTKIDIPRDFKEIIGAGKNDEIILVRNREHAIPNWHRLFFQEGDRIIIREH